MSADVREVTKNDISNVDIFWHQFSIDHDKMWNKVPYCLLRVDKLLWPT